MNTLFVGIDVSKHTNEVLGMLQDGREVDSFRLANDLPDAQALSQRPVKLMTSRSLDHLVVGVEATGLYAWHLVQYLRQQASWLRSATSGAFPTTTLWPSMPG